MTAAPAPHPDPLPARGERERAGTKPLAPRAGRGRDPSRQRREGTGLARRRLTGRCAKLALSLLLLLIVSLPAHAVRPDEVLPDPALEARARDIGKELRCLVCRNQSVDDSDASLAHDLRVLVRQRLTAGDSDAQVVAYVRSRYGDYVLLRPPFQLDTWLLWGGPAAILIIGLWGVGRYLRRQARMTGAPPLSPDEERRLASILDEKPSA
jgi:cytochrome c-type biogenesis protein CcmH